MNNRVNDDVFGQNKYLQTIHVVSFDMFLHNRNATKCSQIPLGSICLAKYHTFSTV